MSKRYTRRLPPDLAECRCLKTFWEESLMVLPQSTRLRDLPEVSVSETALISSTMAKFYLMLPIHSAEDIQRENARTRCSGGCSCLRSRVTIGRSAVVRIGSATCCSVKCSDAVLKPVEVDSQILSVSASKLYTFSAS